MSFQFLNPAPVFFDLPGTAPLSGGEIQFYEKGTTTPKNTWADEALTVLNENPVPLDSAGRTETPVWLDGEYSVVIKSGDGTTVATRDYTSGAGASASIPDLAPGFLTNDGLNLQWVVLREVPDPTGFTNRVLSTDGANLLWIEQQEIPAPDIEINNTTKTVSIGAGGGVKYVTMTGTGTAPASGQWSTSTGITFPAAFSALWNVFITITTGRVSNADSGFLPGQAVTGWTSGNASSGVTVNFVLCEDDRAPGNTFTSSVPFTWTAIGTITE